MDLQNLVKRAVCKNSFSALLQEKRQPQRSFVAQSCLFAPVSLGLVSRLSFSSELDVQNFREVACKAGCAMMSHNFSGGKATTEAALTKRQRNKHQVLEQTHRQGCAGRARRRRSRHLTAVGKGSPTNQRLPTQIFVCAHRPYQGGANPQDMTTILHDICEREIMSANILPKKRECVQNLRMRIFTQDRCTTSRKPRELWTSSRGILRSPKLI